MDKTSYPRKSWQQSRTLVSPVQGWWVDPWILPARRSLLSSAITCKSVAVILFGLLTAAHASTTSLAAALILAPLLNWPNLQGLSRNGGMGRGPSSWDYLISTFFLSEKFIRVRNFPISFKKGRRRECKRLKNGQKVTMMNLSPFFMMLGCTTGWLWAV